jgi:hypothetical protein
MIILIYILSKGLDTNKFIRVPSLRTPNFIVNRFINKPKLDSRESSVDDRVYKRLGKFRMLQKDMNVD